MSGFPIIQNHGYGGSWVLMNVYEAAQSKCQINNSVRPRDSGDVQRWDTWAPTTLEVI